MIDLRYKLEYIPMLALSSIIALGFILTPALAASPHFIGTPTIAPFYRDFSLTASFKAAGLGNKVTDIFLTSSGGEAIVKCTSSDGTISAAFFGPLQGQTVFIQPRNGNVGLSSLTLGPPPLPAPYQVCPDPLSSMQFEAVKYDNVVLHIQQLGVDILTYNFGVVRA